MSTVSADCILCISFLVMYFSFCFGAALYPKCKHNGKTEYSISYSYVSIFLTTMFIAVMFVTCFCLVQDFLQNSDFVTRFKIVTDLSFTFKTGLMPLLALLLSKYIKCLNYAITEILLHSNDYGLKTILPINIVRKLRREAINMCLFIAITVSVNAFTAIYNSDLHLDVLLLANVSAIATLLFDNVIIAQFYVHLTIFEYIFQEAYKHCIEKLSKSKKLSVFTVINYSEVVKQVTRLHLAIHHSFKIYQKFMNPATVIWMLFTCIGLVTNVFVLLKMWFSDDNSWLTISEICRQARFLSTVLAILYNLIKFEKVSQKSNELLSFLFKYPISTLTREEAAQVEILITALKIKKPVLTASDIFTIGVRLLGSISGTVITYVLVALQFNAQWKARSP